MDNRPIGVFDSGVGGLTVLKELKNKLPHEDFIYVGDTARVPYGVKSKATITKFASQIVDFLITKNVKLIVIACNTVSSNSLQELKKNYSLPIMGVIEPGVRLALDTTKNNRIGIIGTQSTIRSHKYKEYIENHNKKIRVYEKACPLFVPLVEELSLEGEVTQLVIKNYLEELKRKKIDTLILGCTHYPLLEKALHKFFDKKVELINSGYPVSLVVYYRIREQNLFHSDHRKGKIVLYASDVNENFKKLSQIVLDQKNIEIKLVSFD